jgi:membrane associated rhomboid family serine protease
MFLHGGFAHVLGNCWFLWVFGNNIEDKLGSFRFAFFYVASGFGAAALQSLVYPASTVPMIGASGAISGVLGAYLFLFPFAWIYTLVPWIVPILPIPALVFLVVWFGLQAVNGYGALMSGQMAHGGVAWWAHAGGFVTGFALIAWARGRGWVSRR